MHYTNTLGQQIRALREAKGYSQEYMADSLNISQSSYAHIESGKTALRVDRLFQILDILDTDIANLLHKQTPVQITSQEMAETKAPSTPELKLIYDRLFQEMRDEILFLRSLIRKTPELRP